MVLNVAFLLAGILLLYAGAEVLVRGSASLARRLNLTPLVIGLTVVAFGTSMPEMAVSVEASLSGAAPIAAGNVVGSNIANIALILGTSALLCPLAVNVRIIRVDLPIVVFVSAGMGVLLLDQRVGRVEGGLLLAGLVGYTFFSLRAARKEAAENPEAFADAIPKGNLSIPACAGLIVAGLVALVIGSRLLLVGSVGIARSFGLSEAVIGLTFIAVGTSLPELATSVLAATRKHGDIAVGNVVGSNIFNILGILGVSSLAKPLSETAMSLLDLGLMIALAMLLLPLARSGLRLSRWEGAFLLITYAAYLVHLLR